jgi:predicted membrane protein
MDTNSNNSNTPGNKRALAGFILVALGGVILLKEFGLFFIPAWLVSWPALLIFIGVLSGIKHDFRNPGSIILIGIGTIFLINRFFWGFGFISIWPVILIAVGLRMILGRNSTWCNQRWHNRHQWHARMKDSTNYSS